MASPLDTEGWKLSATVQWVAKKKPIESVCSYCNGNGEVGGGFKDIDGPDNALNASDHGVRRCILTSANIQKSLRN